MRTPHETARSVRALKFRFSGLVRSEPRFSRRPNWLDKVRGSWSSKELSKQTRVDRKPQLSGLGLSLIGVG
jgi:hypothetical protein